jgi:fucose permease
MALNPVAPIIYEKYGPTVGIIIGTTIALTGLTLSTFCTTFPLFVVFYALFYGVGIGLCYLIPLMCGWEYFP